jgi:cyclopropane fatty-acyl-phospholipid synthase-like methyltransferase
MRRWRKTGMASRADRHDLYQRSVQDVESEIDFIEQTWSELRLRPALRLREDFCGTANTSCEWVRRDPLHHAVGVDNDAEVLAWGRDNNLCELSPGEQQRIDLLRQDVRQDRDPAFDIILAMNFSYYLFTDRQSLREYFIAARQSLVADGILFLDAYGGYEAPMVLQEPRECEGFTYIWDQASFNPINSEMTCHIHFEFSDKTRLDKAFSYHWRLWTLPEILEILVEAGFDSPVVYWEGTDEESNEGNGIFTPAEVGDADPGWVCYIVAQR